MKEAVSSHFPLLCVVPSHRSPFFPSQLSFSIEDYKHSVFSTSYSFTHCKSRFCYHYAHSSTLTRDTNEPLAAKWHGNFSVHITKLHLPGTSLTGCLYCPFLKSFTDSSQISLFHSHILQVMALRFSPSLSYCTFTLRFHPFSGLPICNQHTAPVSLPDIYISAEDFCCC